MPTDLEKFQRTVRRVAPEEGVRGKALYYCNPATGGTAANLVGFIRQRERNFLGNPNVKATCIGDLYDMAGVQSGTWICDDFFPLAK